jgi:TPR repeat protein
VALVLAVVLAYPGVGRADLPAMAAPQICILRAAALAGKDGGAALELLRQGASQGNVGAMRALGAALIGNQDYELALEGMQFAEQAAARGDAGAQTLLAQAYADGRATLNGVPDPGRAQTWFELAAEHGANSERGQGCQP